MKRPNKTAHQVRRSMLFDKSSQRATMPVYTHIVNLPEYTVDTRIDQEASLHKLIWRDLNRVKLLLTNEARRFGCTLNQFVKSANVQVIGATTSLQENGKPDFTNPYYNTQFTSEYGTFDKMAVNLAGTEIPDPDVEDGGLFGQYGRHEYDHIPINDTPKLQAYLDSIQESGGPAYKPTRLRFQFTINDVDAFSNVMQKQLIDDYLHRSPENHIYENPSEENYTPQELSLIRSHIAKKAAETRKRQKEMRTLAATKRAEKKAVEKAKRSNAAKKAVQTRAANKAKRVKAAKKAAKTRKLNKAKNGKQISLDIKRIYKRARKAIKASNKRLARKVKQTKKRLNPVKEKQRKSRKGRRK